MEKRNYQLIAFDMDGTLLDSRKRIRPSSLEAIHRAVLAGRTVVLSTGRNPAEISVLENDLTEVRYRIACSGGMICDAQTGKMLTCHCLREQDTETILKRTEAFDVMIHMLAEKSVVQADSIARMEEFHMGVYRPMYEQIAVQVRDIRREWLERRWPVCKLNLYFRNTEDRSRVEALLADLPLQKVHAEATSLECSPEGVSKAAGLAELCEILNIPIAQTIAVGDADNDLEILRAAGLAVAMGNANERVKAAADVIVADHDADGCAETIDRFLLA